MATVAILGAWFWLSPTCAVWRLVTFTDFDELDRSAWDDTGARSRFYDRVRHWRKSHLEALLRTGMRGGGGRAERVAWLAVCDMLRSSSRLGTRGDPDPKGFFPLIIAAGVPRWGVDAVCDGDPAAAEWIPHILLDVLDGQERVVALREVLAHPPGKREHAAARRLFYALAYGQAAPEAPGDVVAGFAELAHAETPIPGREMENVAELAIGWLGRPEPLRDAMIRVFADEPVWPLDDSPREAWRVRGPSLPDMHSLDWLISAKPDLASRLLAGVATRTARFDALLPEQLRHYAAFADTRPVLEAIVAADIRPSLRTALRRVLEETPVSAPRIPR